MENIGNESDVVATFGQQIKTRLQELQMSVTELSRQINVNRSTVHRYINNELHPSERKLYQIERVLNITMKR